MELLDVEGEAATKEGDGEGDGGDAVEEWTWVFGERMEIEAVDASYDEVSCELNICK